MYTLTPAFYMFVFSTSTFVWYHSTAFCGTRDSQHESRGLKS